jgi:nucleoid-associated protein YgaU
MFAKILIGALLLTIVVAVAANRSEGAGPERAYVVRPYDTLWSIASSQYGGDPREAIDRIERANGLRTALIRPGQRLVLP